MSESRRRLTLQVERPGNQHARYEAAGRTGQQRLAVVVYPRERFQQGDFHDPGMVHGGEMAGLHELTMGAARIRIVYGELPDGAQISYTTDDPELVAAIRDSAGVNRRIRAARFPLSATMEDLDLSPRRGLNRAQLLQLAQSEWVGHHLNLLVLGATGAGKSFLGCALGRAACQAGYKVRYERTSRFLQALELAHADGSYPKLLRSLARTPLLIFDDWLRDPLSRSQATELLEVLDDRYGRSATMVVTQVPVADWHSRIPDPTLSDAILDRLVHNAYRLHLEGESMRKIHSPWSAVAR